MATIGNDAVAHLQSCIALCFPARPGKVVGPLVPYESGSMKDAYDPRRFIRNPVLPLQPAIPPFCFHGPAGKLGSSNRDPVEAEGESVQHKPPPHPCIPSKMAPEIALDMRASPFNGIIAAATAGGHRKVGTIQFGMTRMY
ncbi:hypothetical protein B296_00000204 [Ensete ventricosum]|uniref:Uncharacterized protein n=1 Tax=Ensete ventricosum TaxID=4639 RepID=A0A427BCD0_ENSVE|nr:hypothetical protein B296_00000204 [Ensete ventricosum]